MSDQRMRVCLACHYRGRTRQTVCNCGEPLHCRANGLKVCRSCKVQFSTGPNARNTQRCPTCIANQPRVENLTRTCAKCGYTYRGLMTVCPCGGQMLSASQRDRICPTCRCAFRTKLRQVYCGDCTPADTTRGRNRRGIVDVDQGGGEPKTYVFPCSTCMHGASSKISDTGYLCRIERAGACRPYSVAAHYREATHG
jgi:hypothetical protein